MSDTHPNAYRAQADEKRQLAAQYAAEANDLEVKAKEAEVALGITQPEPVDTGTKPEKSKGLFGK